MRLLYVVPYAPGPVRVRPWEMVRALAARGHEITLAAPWSDAADRASLADLERRGVRIVTDELSRARMLANLARALWTGRPLQAEICWHPALARALERLAGQREPDAVWVEHLRGARFAERLGALRARRGGGWPLIWDSVDCISHLFSQARVASRSAGGRLMAAVDLARTRRYEARAVGRFDRTVVASAADREAFLALAGERTGRERVAVVANGVDLGRFPAAPHPRPRATVVLSGKMSYHANETAARFLAEEVMPRIWAVRPETRLILAGAGPGRRLRALAAASRDRIELTGEVDDLAAIIGRAAVAVAPLLYGAGIQNKVLEAMATATPVVATPLAASAIAAEPGREILLGRDAADLAERVAGLLADPLRAAEIGEAGRRYVERHHGWDGAAAAAEAAIRAAAGARARADG